jgi:integrase
MRARRRGKRTYYFYDVGGKPRREEPLGTDYVLAVQKWATLHQDKPVVSLTVGWAITQYLSSPSYTELGEGTRADYKLALDNLVIYFGDAPLDDVKPSHLVSFLELRAKGTDRLKASIHRGQREIALLGRIFKYARSKDWTRNDPKESIELRKLPGRKNIYVTDEMFDAVYLAGGDVLKEACDIAYLLGQRPIDVLNLPEPKDGTIEVRQTKTGTPIRVAVQGDLKEVIERIAERKKTLKFRIIDGPLLVDERGRPLTKAKLRSRFDAARKKAGVSGSSYQFRDLRAKAATDLRDLVSIEASQALLGHASIVMTEHYTRNRRGKIISAIPRKSRRSAVEK